jgi:ABC-type antimicrobial peptide transport system permease subunit
MAQLVARPGSVDNLDELGPLPLVLATAVAGLGVLAGALALVVGTNRSRRELSTLRAVGAVRRQLLATVFGHALTVAAVGVVLGLPLGIALGRSVYLAVASDVGAIARPVVPVVGIAAVCAATVLIASLVATVPAVRVAAACRHEGSEDR